MRPSKMIVIILTKGGRREQQGGTEKSGSQRFHGSLAFANNSQMYFMSAMPAQGAGADRTPPPDKSRNGF